MEGLASRDNGFTEYLLTFSPDKDVAIGIPRDNISIVSKGQTQDVFRFFMFL